MSQTQPIIDAFPCAAFGLAGETYLQEGMSLRDWFAGQALGGMHARDSYDDGQATPDQRARLAYIDADAMLAARESTK